MNNYQPNHLADDYERYCELGKHSTHHTVRCPNCLRFFCGKHSQHNCKQQSLSKALWHLTTAITYRLLTRPIEKLSTRIRYSYLPHSQPQPNGYSEEEALKAA